jgi:cyclopropane fatty-acyl-phospholipid synthase-like methyltransferase
MKDVDPRSRLYGTYYETYYGPASTLGKLSPSVRAYFDQHLARYLPRDPGAAILDVGCGFGGLLMYLRDRGYVNLAGVDSSPEQVSMAERLGLRNVSLGMASEYLDERRQQFDLIFAIDVLEHLERDELMQLLDCVHAALRPGGRFVLQVPNGASPFTGRLRYEDLTHERAFTARSITQVLGACGFTRTVVQPVRPAVHGAPSAARWALWHLIRLGLVAYLAIESGVLRGHVLSQNLVASAER